MKLEGFDQNSKKVLKKYVKNELFSKSVDIFGINILFGCLFLKRAFHYTSQTLRHQLIYLNYTVSDSSSVSKIVSLRRYVEFCTNVFSKVSVKDQ